MAVFFTEIIFIILGFLIGTVDVVAGGGNLFTVSLLGVAGLPVLSAIATMQTISLVQNVATCLLFDRDRLINWKQALLFIPFGMAGSYFGAHTALKISQEVLSFFVGSLMALLVFIIPEIKELAKNRPKAAHLPRQVLFLMLFIFVAGFYNGIHGGAVGLILLLGFYFIGNVEIIPAAATTKVINIFMSLTASYIFLSQPNLIKWQFGIPMIFGVTIGSFAGVRWAKKFDYLYIRTLLYVVVLGAAAKFLVFGN